MEEKSSNVSFSRRELGVELLSQILSVILISLKYYNEIVYIAR